MCVRRARATPAAQTCSGRTGPSPGRSQKEEAEDACAQIQPQHRGNGKSHLRLVQCSCCLGHGWLLTYLFEDFQQRDAAGVGAVDDALGVLEAKAHHGWVNDHGGDAAGQT